MSFYLFITEVYFNVSFVAKIDEIDLLSKIYYQDQFFKIGIEAIKKNFITQFEI